MTSTVLQNCVEDVAQIYDQNEAGYLFLVSLI